MRILLISIGLLVSQLLPAQRDIRLLVVAPESMEEALTEWITWRQQTGVAVESLWLEDINAFPDATDIQSAMRDKYSSFDFTHVLLVGDAWLLPYHSSDAVVLHDHGYGLLDDLDYAMDVSVGRLPFGNSVDLENYLNFLIAYEKGEISTAKDPSVLVSASTLHHDDAHGHYLDNWTHQQGYTATTLLQSNLTNDRSAFMESMFSGAGFVTYFGHGTNVGWNSISPGFSSADVAEIDFSIPPVVLSAACASSDPRLANNGAFGGQFLSNNALGFIGATEDCYYDYSDTLIKVAHKTALGNPVATLGEILREGKKALRQSFPNNTLNLTHLTLEHFTLLGEPSVIPFRQAPKPMQLVLTKSISKHQIEVLNEYNQPIPDATVSVTDEVGNWLVIGKTSTSGAFECTANLRAGTYFVTAFKNGFAAKQTHLDVAPTSTVSLVSAGSDRWQVSGLRPEENGTLCFYSTTGQQIRCFDVDRSNATVQLAPIAGGVYLYRFESNARESVRGKIVQP